MSHLQHVSTLQGTYSHYGFSTGNCLPLVAMPFGMVHWSAQTSDGGWFFDPRARKLQGVRATHQPSPWMGDYGWFTVAVQVGDAKLTPGLRSGAYKPEDAVFKPHHFLADSIRDQARIEVTPSERGAIFRFTFPESSQSRVIIENGPGNSSILIREQGMEGWSGINSGGAPEGFACYFVAQFDTPIVGSGTYQDRDITLSGEQRQGKGVGGFVEFATVDGQQVTLRVATSFISIEQACHNLELELSAHSFDSLKGVAESTWEEALGRIQVEGGSESQTQTFYSCLYRTMLFPRIFHERAVTGGWIHYSPFDGQVHDGLSVTDNGFWDTYRTMYPLLELLTPTKLGAILEGWLNSYREGGWFPQWASPGYRACMVGTHIDVVFADAITKGVPGFDAELAYEGMRKHAFEVGDDRGSFGRLGINSYLEKGFVPEAEQTSATSRSLDYAYDDFCLSQIAERLEKHEDAAMFRKRAFNYRKLYDPATGFMRGKTESGGWAEPWNEFKWGDPYVEGGAWQSTWAVPHDPAGLIQLMGGNGPFVAKLDQMLTQKPRFEVGSYGFEIHEMTEMACAKFGQYAHSNQPVHHVLYLYTAAKAPWKTQYWVRKVMSELYTPEILPGDEDNGEMSAWYVLSALGLFPLCPGHPSFVLGTPLFKKATIEREGLPPLVIEAPSTSDAAMYVSQVALDGNPTTQLSISHERLLNTTHLLFEMSESPAIREIHDNELPFSLSTEFTS